MCSIIADSDHHRFVLGTCSIPSGSSESFGLLQNEIHVLSFSEDASRIDVEKVYKLPDCEAEVTQISSSPYNRNIFAAGLSTFNVSAEESKTKN